MSRALTYNDFYRTGIQDCGNVLSIDEFDFKAGTPKQIVDKAWAEWEEDGMEEQWLDQQDDLEGLDPHKCYESWRSGWKECAVDTIKEHLERLEEYRLDDEAFERETRGNPPAGWWRKRPAKDQTCYATKSAALAKFLDVNYEIVENYGGADYKVGPSEFDAINRKYDLKGKRAASSIADAVWAAMPVGKPYCLDRIDLDALNDTSPVSEAGVPFRLPDYVHEAQMAEEEARHIGYGQAEDEGELPDWVTEHRRFPALPPLPYRLQLEEQEPGVATFSFATDEEGEPMPEAPQMPPRTAPRPLASSEFKPYRLQLEDREPGVEQYSINPAGRSSYRGWTIIERGPGHYTIVGDGGWYGSLEQAQVRIDEIGSWNIEENPAGKVKIKMTSTRSGKVGWIRPDGTPSDYESEAGAFDPYDAKAVIAEYTENLVRVVGRCANRFEMLPNPPPGEHPRRRKFQKPRAGVHVEASSPTLFRELTRIAIPYTARREDDGSFTIFDEARWKAIMSSCEAHEVEPPKQNPAWVTKILSKHLVKLEEEVPPRFLPKFTKAAFSRGGRLSVAMKEYGCGAYGCVLPTLDPSVVLKLTTDDTEAEFANDLAGKLTKPVVVKYHMTRELPDKYKGRKSYLLWRDAADHVGQVEMTIAEETGVDPTIVEEAIGNQHLAAQAAFEALDEGEPAIELLQKWENAAREMGQKIPELRELADGMITNLKKNRVFMGDVHSGNIGRVNGHWVVVDPGHIAVLTA